MKNLMISAIALVGVLCASCGSNTAVSNDPWAGQTLDVTLDAGTGFGDFADYTLNRSSSFGEDLSIYGYVNSAEDQIFFVTGTADTKVIASLVIPAAEVKPGDGVLLDAIYDNFDASKNYDNTPNPYYVVIRTFDTEYRTFSTDIVKAWRFDPKSGVFEEVPTEGLVYMAESNDWV